MNQITTLFGEKHESFLAKLRKATKRREKRTVAMRAVKSIGKLITLRRKEIKLLFELRNRLLTYANALEDGVDPKLAKLILGGSRGA